MTPDSASTAAVPQRPAGGLIAAAVVIMVGVAGIIAVAFRGSWGALRDAALACHFERSAADLYPWGVDGLLIITVAALVLLRHDRGARRYCLGIIGTYTGASWLINYLHGLGQFAVNPITHEAPVPPWPVVLVVASLVIGSIFLGSHLLVFVWRRVFPNAIPEAPVIEVDQPEPEPVQDLPPVPELPLGGLEAAKRAYRLSLHPTLKPLSQAYLMDEYRITKREAAQVQSEVKAERDTEDGDEPATAAAAGPEQNGRAAT